MGPIRNLFVPCAGTPPSELTGRQNNLERGGRIGKGMIYSPAHGDTAFTVPLFDQFLRRIMPEWHPPAPRRNPRAAAKPDPRPARARR